MIACKLVCRRSQERNPKPARWILGPKAHQLSLFPNHSYPDTSFISLNENRRVGGRFSSIRIRNSWHGPDDFNSHQWADFLVELCEPALPKPFHSLDPALRLVGQGLFGRL